MANYRDIVGTTIRTNAGDLSGAAAGEVWFDSTNIDFKYKYPAVTSAGAWRTGGDMGTARQGVEGFGTQTAAIAVGGYHSPPAVFTGKTESYDGATWTEVADLNQSRGWAGAAGISTAGLAYGGESTLHALSEVWNGSTWTETHDINTARNNLGGA